MTELYPVEGKEREAYMEIMTELHPVQGGKGKHKETNLEIMTDMDPVTKEGKGRQTWKS